MTDTPDLGHASVEDTVTTYGRACPDPVVRVVTATPHTARIVLDVTGHGERGYATLFTRSLCEAIFAADPTDRAKLRREYPEMVDAVHLYESIGLGSTMALANAERPPG